MIKGLSWWKRFTLMVKPHMILMVKWSTLLCMPYVILMGFLVPLGQGITKVSPVSLAANDRNTIQVQGYNTDFKNAEDVKAWLKYDDQLLPSINTLIKSPQEAEFQFDIPSIVSAKSKYIDLNLIINSSKGPIVLPSAFNLKNTRDSSFSSSSQWSSEKLTFNPESNFNYPYRNLMGETIRHTFFHVPLWFAMTLLFMISAWYSIKSLLKKGNASDHDSKVVSLVSVGLLFGVLGIVTGMLWAKFTWGAYWSFDVKQNMAAISLLIYLGMFLLRNSLSDPDAKKRIGNIYNIFAFCLLIPLIFIIPRRYDSLHPGNGGNPGMGTEDLDNTMRVVFYPAVIAYICLGLWIASLYYRYLKLKTKQENA